ncbi:hypothetical protein [Bacillus cereus]|uniref:hypothetical protein n=1 Tax=Bacillus cereus TaxID=1396 RepID=UPI00027A904E|nr:hypothetical protein [Bacillus cereus]EJS69004.1 hypothetical protein ICU_02557 [Bacillus cereus BAG2X1-1]PEA09389.1 hypothetical protein CON38_09825 [Bacillus cereus]PEX78999.1 hypothetical protein CN450_26120 [Bacillus cereus]PFI15101.1 hypothetical protein COI75_24050 [Bacillus cereus]
MKIQKENIILFGSSIGDFIASGIFFSNIDYAGLISINGSSSFVTSERFFRELDMRTRLEEIELNILKLYDPKCKDFKTNAPILFSHGENNHISR